MADFMQLRWSMDGVAQGVSFALPATSLVTPVKAVINSSTFSLFDTLNLPAFTPGTTRPTLLFDAARNAYAFQFVALQLVGGTGFASIAWTVDKPTSSTNLAPLGGVYQRVNQKDLSCWTPELFNTAYAKVHPTLATATGLDGNSEPSILTSTTSEQGRIYRIWGANSSTTTAVKINVWVKD